MTSVIISIFLSSTEVE